MSEGKEDAPEAPSVAAARAALGAVALDETLYTRDEYAALLDAYAAAVRAEEARPATAIDGTAAEVSARVRGIASTLATDLYAPRRTHADAERLIAARVLAALGLPPEVET